ncbi:MAG: autotransporter outer membrane beta-barrel domain-containing protein [Martelella sp.]|uniref:autotransporter outer membrane beta-barrel domain-containing protein n=1 Tax=Martelella sp. TaxID=1969699 RepID=UPI003242FF07
MSATSALALTVFAIAMTAEDTRADDECGQPTSVTYCNGAAYNDITYQSGTNLALNNAAMVVNGDINVGSGILGAKPATITTTSYQSLGGALNVKSSDTNASLQITDGAIDGSSMISGPLTATTTGRGNAVANIQSGTISVTDFYNAVTALAQGSGDAIVNISGNASIEAEISKTAILANNTGSGAANISMTAGNVAGIVEARGIDGSIDISGGEITGGIIAASDGGDFSISLTGGTLTYLYDVFEDDDFDEVIALDVGGNGSVPHSSIHIDGATIYAPANVFLSIGSDVAPVFGSTNRIVVDDQLGQTFLQTALLVDVRQAGTASIEFNGGTLSYVTSNSQINAALSAFSATEDTSVTIRDGAISAVGSPLRTPALIGAQAVSYGNMATVSMSGGDITIIGATAYGLMAQDFFEDGLFTEDGLQFGNSTISMTGGTLSVTAAGEEVTGNLIVDSSAIYIPANFADGITNKITVDGGTITATNANGILAYVNNEMTTQINLKSGYLVVNYKGRHEGYGVAVGDPTLENRSSEPGVTTSIAIGSQMTLDASNAYYAIINLNDAPDNQMLVSTAGTIVGDSMLGGGPSTFTLSGGSLTGDVYGDDDIVRNNPDGTRYPGNDNFIWSGGSFNGGFYGQGGDDSVEVRISNSNALAAATFDGGDGIDTFIFNAGSLQSFDGTKITNFEKMTFTNGLFQLTSNGGTALSLNGFTDSTGNHPFGEITLTNGGNWKIIPLNTNVATRIEASLTVMSGSNTFSILPGDVVFSGSIENNGLITFDAADAPGTGTLTTEGSYSGNSGILSVNANFSRSGFNDALITTGSVSGRTAMLVAPFSPSSTPRVYNIVTVNPSAGVDPNAFHLLKGPVVVSALAYSLAYYPNGLAGPSEQLPPGFILTPAAPANAAAFLDDEFIHRATIKELIDAGLVLQPYVPLYEAYQSVLLEMTRLPSLKTRSGGRYEGGAAITAGPALDAVWGRVGGGFDHFDPQSSTTGYDYDMSSFEMQAGLDGLFLDSEAGALVGGFTAHYQTGEAKVHSRYGDSKIHPDGYGFGGTLTWFGTNGFYTDAQAALTWYSSELKADDLPLSPDDSDAFGYALSLEAGQAFGVGDGVSLTPQAQLSFASVSVDSFTGAYSDDVDFDDGQSLLGRVGLSIEKESAWTDVNGQARAANVYGLANLYYEFLGKTTATVADVLDFSSEPDDFTGEIGFGGSIDWQAGKLRYSAFAELTASTGFSTGSYGYGGNVGLKVRW